MTFGEQSLFGGTCDNTGGTPTKAMDADAIAIHMALRAGERGVVVPDGTSIDMKLVVARREAIVAGSRNGVDCSLRKDHGITVFTGTAEFESPTTVRVGEDVLEAEQIFLDVCARGPCSKSAGYSRYRAIANHLGSSYQDRTEHIRRPILGQSALPSSTQRVLTHAHKRLEQSSGMLEQFRKGRLSTSLTEIHNGGQRLQEAIF